MRTTNLPVAKEWPSAIFGDPSAGRSNGNPAQGSSSTFTIPAAGGGDVEVL